MKLRTLLILGFGAVPAVPPGFLAFVAMMFGFGVTEQDLFGGLSVAVLGLFGTIGALTLWVAAFVPMNNRIVAGIVAGLFAMGPFSLALLVNFVRDPLTVLYPTEGWWFGVSMLTPSIVGVWLLAEYAWQAYAGRRGNDTVNRTP